MRRVMCIGVERGIGFRRITAAGQGQVWGERMVGDGMGKLIGQ